MKTKLLLILLPVLLLVLLLALAFVGGSTRVRFVDGSEFTIYKEIGQNSGVMWTSTPLTILCLDYSDRVNSCNHMIELERFVLAGVSFSRVEIPAEFTNKDDGKNYRFYVESRFLR